MLDKIIEFSSSLRAAGIPVSVRGTETAYKSALLINNDLETLREALAGVYVKEQDQREKFDMIFNIIFKEKLQVEIQESGDLNKEVSNLQDVTGQQSDEIKESRKVNKAVAHLSNEIQNGAG